MPPTRVTLRRRLCYQRTGRFDLKYLGKDMQVDVLLELRVTIQNKNNCNGRKDPLNRGTPDFTTPTLPSMIRCLEVKDAGHTKDYFTTRTHRLTKLGIVIIYWALLA